MENGEYVLFLFLGTGGYIRSMQYLPKDTVLGHLEKGEEPKNVAEVYVGSDPKTLRKQALAFWDENSWKKYERPMTIDEIYATLE